MELEVVQGTFGHKSRDTGQVLVEQRRFGLEELGAQGERIFDQQR